MNEKIELYREVLSWEPNSKVFFPLARLLDASGEPEQAILALRQGLERNPDFLEARLFLVELLERSGQGTEAHQAVSPLAEVLQRYPGFWQAWAMSLPPEQADFSVALGLAGAHLAGTPLNWSRIIEEGFRAVFSAAPGPSSPRPAAPPAPEPLPAKAPETGLSPERVRDLHIPVPEPLAAPVGKPEAGSIRTRTMADLLASQGDYPGAMGIYQELHDKADPADRPELALRLEDLRSRLEAEGGVPAPRPVADHGREEPGFPSKNKLIKTLERLAARLEARAGA